MDFTNARSQLAAIYPGTLPITILLLGALLAQRIWHPYSPKSSPQSRLGEANNAGLVVLFFGFLDWVLLAGLPTLGLSYGSIRPSFAAFTVVRHGVLVMALIVILVSRQKQTVSGQTHQRRFSPGLAFLILVNISILLLQFYGMYIEPFRLETTHLTLPSPEFFNDRPLRIVQLTDIHIERTTRREIALLERVRQLQPDLIVLTGDYLNIDFVNDPIALQDGRALLSKLDAPYGVYAVAGTSGVDTPQVLVSLFEGLSVKLLQNETAALTFPGGKLNLIGVSTINGERDRTALTRLASQFPAEDSTVLLYHTPDLIETASEQAIDLYLAGHTHGGQIRLPWYGALVTFSRYGKLYEQGFYHVDPTTLYVSRGIGMEGMNLPRLRFLCSPEIVVIDLLPGASQ